MALIRKVVEINVSDNDVDMSDDEQSRIEPIETESTEVLTERLLVACRAAGIGVWDCDLVSRRMNYSGLAKEIFGFPPDGEVTLEMVQSVIHPNDLADTQAASQRVLDPEVRAEENYTYRIQRFDTGEIRWIRAHGIAAFRKVGGKVEAVRYTGSMQDVTERELEQQLAAQSETHLRLAIDAAGMAIWDLDLETGEVSHSPELNRILGFPAEVKPTAAEFRARYAVGERERMEAEGAAAQARGDTMIQSRVRYDIPGRGEITCVLRASLALDEKAARRRVIGVLFDITEQARAEERLRTLNREVVHRLKNVASLAGVFAKQTWSRDEAMDIYLGRLRALTLSADLMFGASQERLTLHVLVERTLDAFRSAGENPFEIQGDDIELEERRRMALLSSSMNWRPTR